MELRRSPRINPINLILNYLGVVGDYFNLHLVTMKITKNIVLKEVKEI